MSEWPGKHWAQYTWAHTAGEASECQRMKEMSVKGEAGGKLPCHSACLEELLRNIIIIKTRLKLCSVDQPLQSDKSTYSTGRIGRPLLSDMLMNTKHKICRNTCAWFTSGSF